LRKISFICLEKCKFKNMENKNIHENNLVITCASDASGSATSCMAAALPAESSPDADGQRLCASANFHSRCTASCETSCAWQRVFDGLDEVFGGFGGWVGV
jgi:hypothetical protein